MNIVAITACTAGIAHTYIVAEKLQKAAEELGHNCKVETQGSAGVENELTEDQTMIVEENAVYVPKEYEQMKYDELRAICKEKGINSYGKKRDELIAELKGLN